MQINDMFEKKTINQLSVLKSIYEDEGIINVEQISKKTLLDSKTVNKLIQDILEQVGSKDDLSQIDSYLTVRSHIYQSSWIYKLLSSLFLSKKVSIVSFTREVYISESKLRRKIKLMNDILNPVELKIISRNGYIDFKGTELQIRFLGQQFFWTIFKGGNWPFKEVNFQKTYDLFFEYVFNYEDIHIKDITYIEWCYTFAINIIRFRHGKGIQKEELQQFSTLFSLRNQEKKYISKVTDILTYDYYLSREEQLYLFLLIQAKVQFYMNDILFEQSIRFHQKNNTDIYVVYKEVIRLFMKNSKNKIVEKMGLAVILSANVSATLIHGFNHTHSGYGASEFFIKNAPHLVPKMEQFINVIKKKYPTISFLNQTTYLAVRYAEAYALLNDMMDFEEKLVILLMTDLPFATEELMAKKLESIFYMKANIKFKTLNYINSHDYDLVISTTTTVKGSKGKNIIMISPDLREKDIQKIDEKIREIKKSQKIPL